MDSAMTLYLGVTVTLLVFLLTVTYHVGRQSMRIDKLEEWRRELRAEFGNWRGEVNGAMQRIEMLLVNRSKGHE